MKTPGFIFKEKCFLSLLAAAFMCSGCASYTYLYDVKPYRDGYIVSRNDTVIAEYTIGKDNKAPAEVKLAQERFKRRRNDVESYYKKMGVLYAAFGSSLAYPRAIIGSVAGVFKLPFILVSDYRYEHNPEYRKKIDQRDLEKKIGEDREREIWRAKLDGYIKEDLEKEENKISK